ncbi:MAG TPA: Gfo/Idh/MocA family oxidoreductase [Chloroflexota bacterium]|nr:Gfo/Idh/MocA family oxidoreductase [Chloroflexota bacterium]
MQGCEDDLLTPVRMAQIGTRHGHAQGKWLAQCSNQDVEAVGIWEPDPLNRTQAQAKQGFAGARWLDSADEVLGDPSVVAVAIEGRNHESLAMAQAAIDAGKHLWFDKPAGDDWPGFVRLLDQAAARNTHVQMGYMFRYSPGFDQIASWARGGLLGELFAVRAHMSTHVDLTERTEQTRHRGGILYDLGGHMIDQIVWLLGRPTRVSSVQRNDATPKLPAYADNTVAVFEFESALAVLDIAAMEPRPAARRFEVYGSKGSAIVEPFDPAGTVRLALEAPAAGYHAGEQVMTLPAVSRQQLYERELAAFVAVLRGQQPLDRPIEHERLVQETLLRATGRIG